MRNFDEVVAYNVRRLRKDAGLSIGEFAERLEIGEHVARDYERPRKGQPQRAFGWTEIVHMCLVLDTTLFDLVLPPEGVEIDAITRNDPLALIAASAMPEQEEILRDRDGRDFLSWWLFGISSEDATPKLLKKMLDWRQAEYEKRHEIFHKALDIAMEMGEIREMEEKS